MHMYFICILYVFLDPINLAEIIFFLNKHFVCILYVFLKYQKFSKRLSVKIHIQNTLKQNDVFFKYI